MLKNIALLTALFYAGFSPSLWAEAPPAMPYGELSCHQLYVLVSQREPETQHRRSPLFNEKTNVLATAIGSVTSIGYYYFGFSVGREYYEDYRRLQHQQDLDRLRQTMAQKYCFQKS